MQKMEEDQKARQLEDAANKLTEMKTKKRVRLTPVTRIGAITSSYFAHNGFEHILNEHSYFSYLGLLCFLRNAAFSHTLGSQMKLHSTTQSQLGPLYLEFSYKYISLASYLGL